MGTALTNLVDALALLGNVNLDMNQRRRDDQRGDINNAYKGLCKDGADGSVLLYGDNLSTRIDDINRSNKVVSSLGKTSANANTAYHPNSAFRSSRGRSTGRQQPYGYGSSGSRGGWLGRFRGAFLDRESRPSWRGKSSPRRGAAPAHEISQSLPAKRSRHIDINTCNSKVMPLLYLASNPATNVQCHAGDTRLHHDEWRLLTSDRFILQTVAGATLEFDANPVQLSQPRTIHFSDYEFHSIDNQITNFLKSGIIERATHCNGEFVSNIYDRDKKDGSLRVILNLIDLNQFITYHHFKMDTIDTVINLMRTNCFMASIDLSNAAYFSFLYFTLTGVF